MTEETVEASKVSPNRYADFSDRAIARIIDLAVLTVLGVPLWGIYYLIAAYGNAPSAVLFAWGFFGLPLYIAYFAIMTARTGQTFGKRIIGIQVQAEDGQPPRAAAALLRTIIDTVFMSLLMLLVGFIDYLWLYRRKDRRTLHDLAVGTSVRIVHPWPDRISLILLAAIILMQLTPRYWLVESSSQDFDNMSPTIRKGDWWDANRLAYRRHSPKLGDVVVFSGPFFQNSRSVGRIVGLPGDELVLRNGRVERVLPSSGAGRSREQVTVLRDYLAILGDNRGTPEAAGYPRNHLSMPPPPPPPPDAVRGGALPMLQPPPPWPNSPHSPILLIKYDHIMGKVIGVTLPLWRLHVVR